MANCDIVGVGMSTLDVLLRVGDMPTWEAPGRLADFRLDGGGPVATACVAAARLGARVGYVGTKGNDTAGELKTRFLADAGVDISRIVETGMPEDQVICVYVQEGTGERVFSGLKRLGEAKLPMESLDREYIQAAKYLHLDGYHGDCARQAATWVHEAGGLVCLDGRRSDGHPLPQTLVELIRQVDILICGAGFCQSLSGDENIWTAGPKALEHGPRIVVETRGEEGAYTFTAGEEFHTPAFEVDVVDTTGAGDVFHGAYLVGLLQGWNLRDTALFATAVSASKCTKLGGRAGIPCFEDALDFLRQRSIHIP